MLDDPIHHHNISQEGNDPHLSLAFWADEGIDFIDLFDHLRPALAGNPGKILFYDLDNRGAKGARSPMDEEGNRV